MTIAAVDDRLFERTPEPPPVGSTEFSLHLWDTIRSRGIEPGFHSGYSDNESNRLDFLTGAKLYGLVLEDPPFPKLWKAKNPQLDLIVPQQLQIVDTLGTEHDLFVVELPRRGSKTTTIFCMLLGRCARRPRHQVTFSAQSGVKGSARLREWKTRLDQINPPPDENRFGRRPARRAPQALALFGADAVPTFETPDRGFRILMGEVGKGIYFDNGSQFVVLKPEAAAYRGEAGDDCWLDEAQEIEPEAGEELLAGLLPLQDTKADPRMIISFTAGEGRVGIAWENLAKGRAGDPDTGIIDFAVPEDTKWEVIEDEDLAIALLLTIHPGVGTLTTELKMRKNYRKMNKPKWAREYLSLWPETYGIRVIGQDLWEKHGLSRKKTRPERVAFGMDIKPGGGSSAIVAAWRDARGIAYIEVVEHRIGTSYLPVRSQEITSKYRTSTIAYDHIGEGMASATEMARMRPRPKLRKQTFAETAAGCVTILRDLEGGKLKHFSDQSGLNDAVVAAVKRDVTTERGMWLWTTGPLGGDITCLVAATKALRNWDQWFAGKHAITAGIITAGD